MPVIIFYATEACRIISKTQNCSSIFMCPAIPANKYPGPKKKESRERKHPNAKRARSCVQKRVCKLLQLREAQTRQSSSESCCRALRQVLHSKDFKGIYVRLTCWCLKESETLPKIVNSSCAGGIAYLRCDDVHGSLTN